MPNFDPEMFRIKPKRIISWGIEADRFSPLYWLLIRSRLRNLRSDRF